MKIFLLLLHIQSENFFHKMILTFENEFKTGFENMKWNYPNRKWNYFSYFLSSNQKTSFTKCFSFLPRSSKLIFKTGNGIISPTSSPLIENLFYQMSLIFTKEFIIDFQNRKWNYPNRKQNYLNRKWNYFTHFQTSDQKTYFTKCLSFSPRSSKLIFKTGNGIIQTGNGII